MSEEARQSSAIDQAALVRTGQVSARELVEASLAAIERRNGELNAFVTLAADRALAEADAIAPGGTSTPVASGINSARRAEMRRRRAWSLAFSRKNHVP